MRKHATIPASTFAISNHATRVHTEDSRRPNAPALLLLVAPSSWRAACLNTWLINWLNVLRPVRTLDVHLGDPSHHPRYQSHRSTAGVGLRLAGRVCAGLHGS